MPVPNPNNGYIPTVGERVRIVGACHPRALGKVVEVVKVYEENGVWWYEEQHYAPRHGLVYSGGVLGGVEPAPGCPIDTF